MTLLCIETTRTTTYRTITMPVSQIIVGNQSVADGATVIQRAGRSGEGVITQLHGHYTESASRKNFFTAANQAAQAISVALATTYTGLVLSNPAGSGVNLVPTFFGFAPSVAPAAAATIGLIGNFISTGLTAHTTPVTPNCTFIDGTTAPKAKVDSAATLPNTPVWLQHLYLVFSTLSGQSNDIADMKGVFVIPPGGYIAIGALTAVTGLGSIIWEEIPI